MTKSISTMARKEGTTRAAFQAYYENNHSVLAVQYFPFTKYVRNHLIDAPELWFDTISEFWADDIGAAAALMNGPVGEIFREDERKFCNQAFIGPAGADEHVLSEGPTTNPEGVRVSALIARDGAGAADFASAVLDWAQAAARAQSGVSVDFLQSWGALPFPADAVVWAPRAIVAPLPKGAKLNMNLQVRRIETPAEKLSINQR